MKCLDLIPLPESKTAIDWMFVSPQTHMLKSKPPVWSYYEEQLWEVIRSWALVTGVSALPMQPQRTSSPFYHVKTQQDCCPWTQTGGSHYTPDLLDTWFWTHSLQRKKYVLVLATQSVVFLLQPPERTESMTFAGCPTSLCLSFLFHTLWQNALTS